MVNNHIEHHRVGITIKYTKPSSLPQFIVIYFFIVVSPLWGQQNLVPNFGFEQYIECPNKFSTITHSWDTLDHLYLKNWKAPNLGTSDFYHECSPFSTYVSVPNNVAGFVPAAKGKGYAGIYLYSTQNPANNDNTYREYLQVELIEPLKPGEEYCVSLLTRPLRHNITDSSSYIFAVSDLGIHLGENQVFNNIIYVGLTNLQLDPQIKSASVLSEDRWARVAAVYKAQGGEKWLTIGNFKNDLQLGNRLLLESPVAPPPPFGHLHYAYYFIDEVFVYQTRGSKLFPYEKYLGCEDAVPLTFSARDDLDFYQWSTGETTQTMLLDTAGQYFLDASFVGCPLMDSVLVELSPAPVVDLGPDLSLCEMGKLNTVTLSNTTQLANYNWSTHTGDATITTSTPGIYRLSTEHVCGHFEDTLLLKGCDVNFYIPNIITPDSDDINSVFMPMGENITVEKLEIYDHFGRMIFHQYANVSGWDGKIRGSAVAPGVYIYSTAIRDLVNNSIETRVGDITVIR